MELDVKRLASASVSEMIIGKPFGYSWKDVVKMKAKRDAAKVKAKKRGISTSSLSDIEQEEDAAVDDRAIRKSEIIFLIHFICEHL